MFGTTTVVVVVDDVRRRESKLLALTNSYDRKKKINIIIYAMQTTGTSAHTWRFGLGKRRLQGTRHHVTVSVIR